MTQSVEWKNQLLSKSDKNDIMLYGAYNPLQKTLDDYLLPDKVIEMFASIFHKNGIKDFTFSATIEYTTLSTGELDICKPHLHAVIKIKRNDLKKVDFLLSELSQSPNGFTELYLAELRSITQAVKYDVKQLESQNKQNIKPLAFRYTSSKFSNLFFRKSNSDSSSIDELKKHLINPLKNTQVKFQNRRLTKVIAQFVNKLFKINLKTFFDSS